ncbi:hypothetical protein [Bradyrhizobium sp.]|uniref:baeRF11 domain-containing protein n=1 Tax=Bradyrhizobium sp. TaxID=376 RepID=UPI00273509F1|nr:hypothetical protein [Bradyrhizobium sp.]MDP3691871.1 hypothetical protein [Bradyrhizobium sp.]
MLHVDIPTRADLLALSTHRDPMSISIYLPTSAVTQNTAGERIELKNLAKDAMQQLDLKSGDKGRLAELSEHLDDLVDDDEFWRFQARSLAILATPDNIRTFRLPNTLLSSVAVSDRFDLMPLLRAVTFPQVAIVLALAEGSVRVIEVSADLPAKAIKVDGLPRDAGSAVGRASVNDRSPSGRIQGSEGQKVLLRQFARKVDGALRPFLSGSDVPLVLAAAQPLASIYRSVNSYAHLAEKGIDGSPETLSDAALAEQSRVVLDDLHREEIDAWGRLFQTRASQERATTDVTTIARAATFGAVESLLVNIDETIHGTVDDETGAITFADHAGADSYSVVAEIASRAMRSQGRVFAVRKDDIPEGKPLAAVLRYAV